MPKTLVMQNSFSPWLIVCSGIHSHGGMDKANLALAQYLIGIGREVHLVAHHVDEDLRQHPLIHVHLVPRLLGSVFLASPLLDLRGRYVAQKLRKKTPTVRTVVNGGNCLLSDVNWSHYVNSAWKPVETEMPFPFRVRSSLFRTVECHRENRAYRMAKLVIANSEMTRKHVLQCMGGRGRGVVRTVYLGSDPNWGEIQPDERTASRAAVGIQPDAKIAIFVGALSKDGRKGFDVLFKAWIELCKDPVWDVDLWVAGEGSGLANWREQVARAGLTNRIRLLGFRKDIPALLASADLLVSPVRYEPYGLNLQEALCRGLSIVTSSTAGIAERFPSSLKPLLLEGTPDVTSLITKLKLWRANIDHWRETCQKFGRDLRRGTWQQMAADMVKLIDETSYGT